MNPYAIYHAVDSPYCFTVSRNEITIKLRTAKDDMEKVFIMFESKYVIGERQRKLEMKKQGSGLLFDYYSITLKLEDTRLAYVFYLYDGKEYKYFSEEGLSDTYDFTLGFYNFFQYPFFNEVDVTKQVSWTKNAVFYQIFVERFAVGDTEADKSYVNMDWLDKPTPKSFAGGDLKGITGKLGYIKDLGVNTIYLTPVFRSDSNHKYDIIDYYEVDKQFGTNQDLKDLIDSAHAQGMRIVLDAVFNHCSYLNKYFQDVMENGKESPYYDWFIVYGDKPERKKGNYEMFATCDYMPKLNTSDPGAVKYLCDIGCHYIKEYGIDGWRLDVSDEVSHDFWRKFRSQVKATAAEAGRECVIIGENWHDASSYLRGDQYDSIMNYSFTKVCLDYFAKDKIDAKTAAGRLNDILMRNTDTVNSMMLNLLDSHDTHRFFSEVGCDEEKMKAALALLFMFPGMPCIYYGTEHFMQGGFDPDCRRCIDWEGVEKGNFDERMEYIRSLTALRAENDLTGSDAKITAEGNVLVVKRSAADQSITLYINLSDSDESADGRVIPANSHEIVRDICKN